VNSTRVSQALVVPLVLLAVLVACGGDPGHNEGVAEPSLRAAQSPGTHMVGETVLASSPAPVTPPETRTTEEVSRRLSGDYLGQQPPGLTPQPFAPAVFGPDGVYGPNLHSSVYFTQAGDAAFFSNQTSSGAVIIMIMRRRQDQTWDAPMEFPPPPQRGYPLLALPDGSHRLYFYSTGAAGGAAATSPDRGLWLLERMSSGWSKPYPLSSVREDQGTMYFSADLPDAHGGDDVYWSSFGKGRYRPPQNLGPPVNSDCDETVLCGGDTGFLIVYRFCTTQRSERGAYVSFRGREGAWGTPVSLDRAYGFELVFDASLSPEGQYVFLLDRGRGVYWVDVQGLERLKDR